LGTWLTIFWLKAVIKLLRELVRTGFLTWFNAMIHSVHNLHVAIIIAVPNVKIQKIIYEWFNILYEKMSKYGFAPEDIWNFDEIGFATGLCSTTEVVTNCDYYGRAKLLQPGNHEWVTANEVVSAVGVSTTLHYPASKGASRCLV
jgi:hypothetical protein